MNRKASSVRISGSDEDRTRFSRLCRIIIDLLTQILRDLLYNEVVPTQIFHKVNQSNYLKKLQKEQILIIDSAKTLGYQKFDITLLYTLLRNVCPNIQPPSQNWGVSTMPSQLNEITVGDDIERIRLIRNKVGHISEATIPETEFKEYWSTFSGICTRMQTLLNKDYLNRLQEAQACTIDVDTERRYFEVIKKQADEEKTIIQEIKKLADEIKSTRDMTESKFAELISKETLTTKARIEVKEMIVGTFMDMLKTLYGRLLTQRKAIEISDILHDDEDDVTMEKQSGNEEENKIEETEERLTKTQKALVWEIEGQTKGEIKESKQSKESQQRKQDIDQEKRGNEEEIHFENKDKLWIQAKTSLIDFRKLTSVHDFSIKIMLEDDPDSRRRFSRYMVGSYVEGTHITDSDLDILFIWENVTICQNVEEIHKHDGAVFVMERSNSPPGYTKLKLVEKQTAKENILIGHKSIIDVVEKTDMGKYLSNTKIIECFAQYLRKKQFYWYIERNDPCVTAKNVECSQGFELCSITDEGNQWLDKMDASEMERIWPSPLTIEKIKKLKCHVVAVGGPDRCSPDSSLNMRVSYTLWEKELVSSFHDAQFFCLVYLKMLNRKKLKEISQDVSSFHIKNIVFWESIECSQDLFQFKNLRILIKQCLVRLQTAVKKKSLSHFIDRDRNLFESKLQDENDRQNLIHFLDNAEQVVGTFNQIYKECMEQICSQDFYKIKKYVGMPVVSNQKLRRCEAFLQKGVYSFWIKNIIFEKAINATYAFYVRMLEVFDALMYKEPDDQRIWLATDEAAQITSGMNESIEWISDAMEKVNADQETLDMMKKNVLFRFGISAATFRIYWDKKRTRQRLQERSQMEDAFICQKLNQHTDALSGLLYLCTYYVREKRFLEANSMMDAFLKSGPKLLLYIGECSTHNGIHVENGIATYVQYENIPLDVTDDTFPYVHNIIVFEGHDTFFFPPIVQIQILLEGTFLIDPVVYLYFLKVVCDIGLNRNADNSLERLRDTVCDSVDDKNKFRRLNLLAYAFQLAERYDVANRFLKDSIDCNMDPLQNSAFELIQGADLTDLCEKLALSKFN